MSISRSKYYYIFIFCFVLLISCGEPEEAPALMSVSKISMFDNGNAGNGSDVEVNFEKQSDISNLLEYRIILIKSAVASNFNIKEATEISSSQYTAASSFDIIPIRGVNLKPDAKDSDGDLINDQESYIAGVLSVSDNFEISSNTFNKSSIPFQLSNNNILRNHSQDFNFGGGSISIDSKNNLYLGSYNVIGDLFGEETEAYPIVKIGSSGNSNEFTPPYRLLGGNYMNSSEILFQSILQTGSVLIIDASGVVSELNINGYQLNSADGIYIDQFDNVFIVDPFVKTIAKITPDGTSTRFATVKSEPKGISGDREGNLYVSHNSEEGLISKITKEGEVSTFANIPVKLPDNYNQEFIQWLGYTQYYDGYLYVASTSTDRIYRVDVSGDVSVFVGSGMRGVPRGGALTANLNRPFGLAFSKDGKILFVSGSADTNPVHTQSSSPSVIWKVELEE